MDNMNNNETNDYKELLDISNSTNFASKKYKLTLRRPSNFVGCLVGFDVYLDDVKVAKIKNGKTIELEVAGGAHSIRLNKCESKTIFIDKDTTADVTIFGANNFGITNINGESGSNEEINEKALKTCKNNSNGVLISSILLPTVSAIMIFTIQRYLLVWIYGIVIGYAIVNIFGLKNFKNSSNYKSLLIKNIIGIVLSIIAIVVTGIITI